MKLINNLKRIITEVASIESAQSSIKSNSVVIINYDGEEYGKGYRRIEPVCLGISKSGNLVLRAWEIEGSSHSQKVKSNPIPGWRLFRLDKVLTYKPTMDKFTTIRPKYNPNGDKSMSRVFVNASFDNINNELN